MPFSFGNTSLARLATVKPRLRSVVMLALTDFSPIDFMVLEGARSRQRQHQLYGQGRSRDELRKAGVDPALAKPWLDKVTWTLNSNHYPDPRDGLSSAVDLVPWPVDWKDLAKFDAIAKAMFEAAHRLQVAIRWGADWDQDGNPRERGESDSPHFELVR